MLLREGLKFNWLFLWKALTTLVKSFPKKLANYMNDILAQVWSCLVQSSNFYVTSVVNCKKENRDDLVDAEGLFLTRFSYFLNNCLV